MLLGAGLEHSWHHARAHRFFSAARWCIDEVGLAMTDLIVMLLLETDAPIVVVVDDTLFKRSGKKVFGTCPTLSPVAIHDHQNSMPCSGSGVFGCS